MGTLYDSTTATDIPTSAPGVAGYADGLYKWSEADWQRFPNALRARIAVANTTLDADILDVENGDAIPSECPYWIRNARYKFRLPIIYCNRYTRPFVETACAGLKYDLWISTLDGIKVMQPGAIMTQWAGEAQTGRHFDLSIVDDNWANLHGGFLMALTDVQEQQIFDWVKTVYIALTDNVPIGFYTNIEYIRTELEILKAGGGTGAALPQATQDAILNISSHLK